MNSQAFNEGYYNGVYGDNPYNPNSKEYNDWEAGNLHAFYEISDFEEMYTVLDEMGY